MGSFETVGFGFVQSRDVEGIFSKGTHDSGAFTTAKSSGGLHVMTGGILDRKTICV